MLPLFDPASKQSVQSPAWRQGQGHRPREPYCPSETAPGRSRSLPAKALGKPTLNAFDAAGVNGLKCTQNQCL